MPIERWSPLWYLRDAIAKQGAALSALPLRARTPLSLAACPCACCDESRPARPGILQPPGTRAGLQQTSASATTPSRAMTLPALSRNEQRHWTSPNLQPWQPWRRVPDLAPCTPTPPRRGTHPEGMNNTGPAKRGRYCNASRSSRKHTARAHLQGQSQNVRLVGDGNKVNVLGRQVRLVTRRDWHFRQETSRPRSLSANVSVPSGH